MKKAHSLQEVLIASAIMGIIACFTVPSVMSGYRQKILSEKKTVFLNDFREVLNTMHIKGKLTGQTTTALFVDDLKNYMKIKTVCDSSELANCFPSFTDSEGKEWTPDKLQTAGSLGKGYADNNVGLVLNDGTQIIITHNPDENVAPPKNVVNSEQVTEVVGVVYKLGDGKNKVDENIALLNAALTDRFCDGYEFGNLCYDSNTTLSTSLEASKLCQTDGKRFPTVAEIKAACTAHAIPYASLYFTSQGSDMYRIFVTCDPANHTHNAAYGFTEYFLRTSSLAVTSDVGYTRCVKDIE